MNTVIVTELEISGRLYRIAHHHTPPAAGGFGASMYRTGYQAEILSANGDWSPVADLTHSLDLAAAACIGDADDRASATSQWRGVEW